MHDTTMTTHTPPHILLIEDDEDIAATIIYALEHVLDVLNRHCLALSRRLQSSLSFALAAGTTLKPSILFISLLFGLLGNAFANASQKPVNHEQYFLAAVSRGEIENVRTFISEGININYQEPKNGMDALSIAAFNKNKEMVNLLLESRIDVNLKNKLGVTALQSAILANDLESVNLILSAGAKSTVSNAGLTSIMLAASVGNSDIIKVFMNRGESINVAQPDGWTPIMHAIAQNKEDTVIFLLKNEANLSAMASVNENTTPISVLEIAKHYGNPNIIHAIETAANKMLKDAP